MQFSEKTPEGVHDMLASINCAAERCLVCMHKTAKLHITVYSIVVHLFFGVRNVTLFSLQTISTDRNAETLSARYEPHVCLTRDALFRLLNNHGPDFGEQWELPVWVKLNQGQGKSSQSGHLLNCINIKKKKIVYKRKKSLYI